MTTRRDIVDRKRRPPWWRRLLPRARSWTRRVTGRLRFWLYVAGHVVRGVFLRGLHAAQVLAGFCAAGWKSRHLAAALPALLVIGMVAGLALARSLTSETELMQRYLRGADAALRTNDYAAARTYFQKAMLLGNRRPEVRFALALCQEQLGRPAAARALLVPLTEDGPGGYAPALLHNGQRLLNEANPSPKAVQEAIHQVERAVALQPNLTDAQLLLGRLYWSAGRLSEAEAALLRVAQVKPAVQLLLVNLCQARGDVAGAKRHAVLARDFFLPQVQTGNADEATVLGCSQAYLRLEEYAAAVTVLSGALARHDSPTLRRSLGDAYAAWAGAEKEKRPANSEVPLRLLETGLRFAPDDARLLKPLLELSKLPGPEAAQARALLEKMLVEGPPSAVLHLLLGLDAWQHGQQEAGRVHLEQAYRITPNVALVANNLAGMLAEGDHPDLTRALALADAAVQRWPEDAHFRDTRGHILVKLGRYKEALADLEAAQQGMPDNARLHAALATTYDHLGMATLAEAHRRQAERKPAAPSK